MKKIMLALLLCSFYRLVFPFFPYFYGARSLALGYSSLAFTYDVNAIYLNPAQLSSLTAPLGGYQFESSFFDYLDFSEQLEKISAMDLKNYQGLNAEQKSDLLQRLNNVFSSPGGISGFQFKNPGFAGKGYGVAVAFMDSAIVYPLANPALAKSAEEISNADIASLQMRFIGFHYTQYSFAYSFSVSQSMILGLTVHYMKGKASEFNVAVVDAPFKPASGAKEYLQFAWSGAQKDFSKLNLDLAASINLGQYFAGGLVVKNVANPVISSEIRDLKLPRRLIAGLAFRPDRQWGISLDIDVAKSELFHDGRLVQPVSLGIEKGFFMNKFFLRAGFLSDLSEKNFLGRKSNILYGIGIGFNLASLLVDFALGLDRLGNIKNLAISGFYLLK